MVEGYPEYDTWLEGIKYMYTEYGRRFAENGTTAIIGTCLLYTSKSWVWADGSTS